MTTLELTEYAGAYWAWLEVRTKTLLDRRAFVSSAHLRKQWLETLKAGLTFDAASWIVLAVRKPSNARSVPPGGNAYPVALLLR